MVTYKLLWVDDEIELLKAHILFLEKKGYEVETVTNGYDALDRCAVEAFDLILLDENMPGLSGLETLTRVKELLPATPVVMVTKSEEEHIMEQAIGAKIADYLIKPVNPTQILLSLKKNIQQKEIVTEHTQSNYQQDFSRLGMLINDASSIEEWKEVYKRLTYWELQLSETESGMQEMLAMQKHEANAEFAKFIRKNYMRWMQDADARPVMSPDIFKRAVFPLLDRGEKVFLVVIDNFRYDQWRMLLGEIADGFSVEENMYEGGSVNGSFQPGNWDAKHALYMEIRNSGINIERYDFAHDQKLGKDWFIPVNDGVVDRTPYNYALRSAAASRSRAA